MNDALRSIASHSELLALIIATAGGAFALWRWVVDQKWRRVLHAQALVDKFLEKKSTIKAFEILDVVDEAIEFEFPDRSHRPIELTNEFLIGALSTFDQKEINDEKEIVVRDILDDLFEDLNNFQGHIEAGLVKVQDIKPYLEYWIQELTGKGRVHDDPKFGAQVARYLNFLDTRGF
jgi:hypothetical protein